MPLKHSLRKKSTIVLSHAFLACLAILQLTSCASDNKEKAAYNLRITDSSREKAIYSTLAEESKPVVYTIGRDDVLGISVWQDLTLSGKGPDGKPREYNINKGDVLEISVWHWPDLLKEVIVRPDGKISFPLVGDVRAEGMTLSELDTLVTNKLTEFIKSPEVSIMMKQFGISGTGSGANRGVSSFVKVIDLSQDSVKVRPDGKISFPMVGDVEAEGLTLDELRLFLSSKISKYVNNTDVYIEVNEFGGNKVIVLGEVFDPGTYKMAGTVSVLEAISLAGGYTKDAILRNVFVVRGDLNKPEVIRVNLSKAITGKDFAENVLIKAGDIVYVPRSLISDISYVVSLVLQPLSSSSAGVSSIQTIRGGTSPIK